MYLARCNNQLGEQTASANNWQRVLEAAQGDARKLITLAQYAEQNKEAEIAEAAYNNAAAITPRLRLAHDVLAADGAGEPRHKKNTCSPGDHARALA